ncbi:MAG: hypothetical protein M3Y87_19065 [Myxococcota bacterium]|nr:hypothetical protein [Myxococcota bacterium]
MRRSLWAHAMIVVAALGCGSSEPLTELLVVVDSDLAVPAGLDAVRVEVSGAMSASASGSLTGAAGTPLPRTVGLVHRGVGLGPIEVNVIGTSGGAEVIRARAITSFIRGRTLVLPIMLARTCAGVTCGAGQTCSGGDCVSASVDPNTLEEWSGDVPRLDGGQCFPFDERCNERDDDCDGRIDEGIDVATDPTNCGACGVSCALPNTMGACTAGACTIGACDEGFGDCNGMPGDGCELDLTASAEHCGACDATCALPNAMTSCADAACALDACDAGFADCDADPTNGCETATTTLTDCGACGVACDVIGGMGTCETGSCAVMTCDVGLGDCNADATDGCETTTTTLTDCGGCGVVCDVVNGTETCDAATCAIVACDAGFADCDADATNGCETATTTLANCGACGTTCALANASETCATGTCAILTCDAGRGDCDASAANGCEVDLTRTDAHCGMCGNACAAGDTCRMSTCR